MTLDVNALRILVTLLSFITFVGIVRWACSRKNAAAFDEAAQLPFQDGEQANGRGPQP
ncbi:MAG: cbb3-type cytochrome c oxidase subunit 3 [Burkholderiales bacterium]